MRFPISLRAMCAVASVSTTVLALAVAPHTAHAQTPIIDFTGGTGGISIGANNFGFAFNVTGMQTITGLGLFDYGSDGLVNSHQVGLFTNTGTLLASATITNAAAPVASTSPLGRYLQVAITPVVLTSGTYVLGASYLDQDDDPIGVQSSATNTPGFTFGGARNAPFTAPLTYPSNPVPALNAGVFGPMAFTTGPAAAAPEPGAFPFFSMGLTLGAGILSCRREMGGATRRRKNNAKLR